MRQNEALAFLNLGWTYVNSFSAQVLVFCAFDAERDINRGSWLKTLPFPADLVIRKVCGTWKVLLRLTRNCSTLCW